MYSVRQKTPTRLFHVSEWPIFSRS